MKDLKQMLNKIKTKIKNAKNRFMKSRFLAFTLGIIIGGTYTYIYMVAPIVFRPLTRTIEIHDASAETASGKLGGAVKAYPLAKTSDLSRDGIKRLVARCFKTDAPTALKIMQAESGGNPRAIHKNKNGTIDVGLFQINSIHGYSKDFLFNPENNVKIASKIFQKSGWNAWVSYRYAKRYNLPI